MCDLRGMESHACGVCVALRLWADWFSKGLGMKFHLMCAAGVWALSTLAASAQEASADDTAQCAGSVWIGGSADTAVLGAETGPLVQEANASANQLPVFAFRIDGAAQETRIEAASVNGDPVLTLTTPQGGVLGENDDYGGTLNAQIATVLQPGTYCVRLSSLGGEPIAATLQVSRMDQAALLPEAVDVTIAGCGPDTPTTALAEGPLDVALAAGRVSQDIGPGVAYMRFELASAASLTMRAESDLLDPLIKLYDGAGVLVAENDDADDLNARLDFLTALPAGSYCLAAAPLSAGEGTITVSVETLDRDSYLRGAWQRGEIAPPEGADFPVQMIDLVKEPETVLLHDGGAQWLSFELSDETVLSVASFGQLTGVDTRLALFGASGIPVATADDSTTGTDAVLGPVLLKAGRYRMAVMDVNGVARLGGPIRPIGLVFERFVRVK